MAYYILIAVIIPSTIFILWYGGRIVATALRTRRLLARGAIYDRANGPFAYYGLIAFWLLLFLLMLYASIGLLVHWPTS
jgi:hypothetical protein